jgi:hypothetical protein
VEAPSAVRTAVRDDLHLFLGTALNTPALTEKYQRLIFGTVVEAFSSLLSDREELSLFDTLSQLLLIAFPISPAV